MTNPVELLANMAAKLKQEGKTPSLALFRSRLAGQIPAPQLFSAYQQWKANPSYGDSHTENAPAKQHTPTLDSDIQATLIRIEAKLDLLLSKLER